PSSISAALSASQLAPKRFQPSATDDASDNTPRGHRHGRSQKKNIPLAAGHAPLGGCVEEANLYRGQRFRRIAPAPPPRSEDRHVQGPPGSEGQEGILTTTRKPCRRGGANGGARWRCP